MTLLAAGEWARVSTHLFVAINTPYHLYRVRCAVGRRGMWQHIGEEAGATGLQLFESDCK